jgi:regulator of cell morphogenesis and NO signaling
MESDTRTLHSALTVNEMMRRHPSTMAVFNRFGIDTCCGGGALVADAAELNGVALATLLDALATAIGDSFGDDDEAA